MFTVKFLIPNNSQTFFESLISFCSPFGIITPMTLSLPKASVKRAAQIVESFPPLIPTIAGPFLSLNQSLIQSMILS